MQHRFADEADDEDDIFGNSTMDRPRRPGLSHQSSVSSSPNKQAARGADSNDWLNEAVGLSGTKKEMPKQVNICIGYQLWDLVIKNL